MLTEIVSSQYRKFAYAAYALIGVVFGAIQVAYLNIAGQPQWLTIALAVYAFVGTALGATAGSNVYERPAPVPAPPGAHTPNPAALADLAAPVVAPAPVKAPAKKAAAKKAAPGPAGPTGATITSPPTAS